MNFISLDYLQLFGVVFVAYYLLPRIQIALLVVASLFFYGYENWNLLGLLLLVSVFSSAVTFALMRGKIDRKTMLLVGVGINLAVLAFFKYKFLFVTAETYRPGEGIFLWLLHLPLPVGISFYTFHCISLIADTYKGYFREHEVEEGQSGFFRFASRVMLYLIFFPQIIAGPIVKAHQFMPQIGRKYLSDVPFAEAARWVIWGLFFKSFVADNLNQFTVWMSPDYMHSFARNDLALLLLCYSFQIFADFAGYSAIALGSAALLGYRLPINFDRPYIAASFSDFWRRWHISLSSFLREYLYIPLGGNRKGPIRTYVNLIVTMGLGGLWHGAALSFLAWGLMHGLALAIERFFSPVAYHIPNLLRLPATVGYRLVVFLVVSFLWVFFKLQDFYVAAEYTRLMFTSDKPLFFHSEIYPVVALYAAPVLIIHLLPAKVRNATGAAAALIYGAMLFLAIFDKGHTDAFIYFQF